MDERQLNEDARNLQPIIQTYFNDMVEEGGGHVVEILVDALNELYSYFRNYDDDFFSVQVYDLDDHGKPKYRGTDETREFFDRVRENIDSSEGEYSTSRAFGTEDDYIENFDYLFEELKELVYDLITDTAPTESTEVEGLEKENEILRKKAEYSELYARDLEETIDSIFEEGDKQSDDTEE